MRLGVAGRRRVAIGGWLLVALPCLAASAITAFLAAAGAVDGRAVAHVVGVVESREADVRRDGNATRTGEYMTYRYEVDGRTYRGVASGWGYEYQNEGARHYEADRTAWLPEERPAALRAGDPVTVYYEPGAPARSTLGSPIGADTRRMLTIWAVAGACTGLLLTWLGWLYYHDPVEILVASPERADAIVAAAAGELGEGGGVPEEEVGISTDVARIQRREGITRIDFVREAGPAFRLSGLYPPVLLLVVLVWAIVLRDLGPSTPRGLGVFAAIAAVLAFLAVSMAYARSPRALWIRPGVLEVATRGIAGRSRRRYSRTQIDRVESRWALSEVSRLGEAAYFDVVAVLGNGKRLRIAEGLPRVEVADALTRLVVRELGLAPEQALTARAARTRDIEIARDAMARPPNI
jgi:hypothetical protein